MRTGAGASASLAAPPPPSWPSSPLLPGSRAATRRAVLTSVGDGLLGACGGTRAMPASPADIGTGPITWMLNGSAERMAAYQRIADAFVAQNAGRQVEIAAADDPIGKVTAMVVAGSPPDVSTVTPVWVAGLAEKGIYQPLEPLLARDRAFKLDDYQPAGS